MDSLNEQQWLIPRFFIYEDKGGRSTLAAVVGLLILVACYLGQSRGRSHGNVDDFKNENGDKMKEYEKNTRFMRFLQGRELSDAGQTLAGDNPYLVQNGTKKELVIWAPDHLQEFHRRDAKEHFKPFDMNMGNYAWQLLGVCLGQQSGQKWKAMRAHLDPEFSVRSANNMMPDFMREITKWADSLSDNATQPSVKKNVFVQDVMTRCKSLVLGLISMTIYGNAYQSRLSEIASINDLHTKVLMISFLGSRTRWKLYNYLPMPEKFIMSAFQNQWRRFNLSAIKFARETNINCPAERIYRSVDQYGDMTLTEYLQTMDEMLFTNIDISGAILAFIFTNLAQDQAFQDKLRHEVLAEKASSTVEAYISKQDTLLHYAILESMRVTPSMHFSLPECNGSAKRIAGYTIPANTPTIIDIRRLNTNRAVWGADAETFRPERFVGLDPARYRFGFVRWGIGRDKCLGKNMADMFLKLAIVAVLERYILRRPSTPPPAPVSTTGAKAKAEAEAGQGGGGDGFTIGGEGEVEFSLFEPSTPTGVQKSGNGGQEEAVKPNQATPVTSYPVNLCKETIAPKAKCEGSGQLISNSKQEAHG